MLVRERGDNGLFITQIPNVLLKFFYSFAYQFWGLLLNYDWLVYKLSVQMFQALISSYRRGNFVCHYWGCTLIYLSLSYPFRSLVVVPQKEWSLHKVNFFSSSMNPIPKYIIGARLLLF